MTEGQVVTYCCEISCRDNVFCTGQRGWCSGRVEHICKEMNRGSQLMSLSYRGSRGKLFSKDDFLTESLPEASSLFELTLACF